MLMQCALFVVALAADPSLEFKDTSGTCEMKKSGNTIISNCGISNPLQTFDSQKVTDLSSKVTNIENYLTGAGYNASEVYDGSTSTTLPGNYGVVAAWTFGSSMDIDSASTADAHGFEVQGAEWNSHSNYIDLHFSGPTQGHIQKTVPAGVNTCVAKWGSTYQGGQADDFHGIKINGVVKMQKEGTVALATRSYACSPGDMFTVFETHGIFNLYSVSFENRNSPPTPQMSWTFGTNGDIGSAGTAQAYGFEVQGAEWNSHSKKQGNICKSNT
jgi:hypothetical protein